MDRPRHRPVIIWPVIVIMMVASFIVGRSTRPQRKKHAIYYRVQQTHGSAVMEWITDVIGTVFTGPTWPEHGKS